MKKHLFNLIHNYQIDFKEFFFIFAFFIITFFEILFNLYFHFLNFLYLIIFFPFLN